MTTLFIGHRGVEPTSQYQSGGGICVPYVNLLMQLMHEMVPWVGG